MKPWRSSSLSQAEFCRQQRVYQTFALVYRTTLVRLQARTAVLIGASQDLEATRWQTFRYVLLPNLKVALVTAAMLAFALSFDGTIITLFLVGDTNTLRSTSMR